MSDRDQALNCDAILNAAENLNVAGAEEKALTAAGLTAAAVPVPLFGVLSAILTGAASAHRQKRVISVIEDLAKKLKEVDEDSYSDYVKGADFEDLLFETLDRARKERSDEKRKAYASLLFNAATAFQTAGYDEKIQFVRLLEIMSPSEIGLLKILTVPQHPNEVDPHAQMGSYGQTLRDRTSGRNINYEEIMGFLSRRGLTREAINLNITMTASGAANLGSLVTPVGRRFSEYVFSY